MQPSTGMSSPACYQLPILLHISTLYGEPALMFDSFAFVIVEDGMHHVLSRSDKMKGCLMKSVSQI